MSNENKKNSKRNVFVLSLEYFGQIRINFYTFYVDFSP